MLASRLLSILMLLQTRGRISATALAREFEVSVRTIHRDIDQLSAAGVPVYAERGRAGGFALMDGYRTRLTGLTQPEAEAIFLAGLPGPAAQLGLSDLLTAARLKLLAALPANVQPDAERIASRFHLDPVSWFRAPDTLPQLPIVARAVWSAHYLKLKYRNMGEVYARKLGPLGLVLKGGVWYLVAQSGTASSGEAVGQKNKTIRTYRVAAMVDPEVTDEKFVRPRKFDLAAHWERAAREYETGTYRDEADVRLSRRGMARLAQLGQYVKERAAQTAGPPDKDGWVRCQLPVEPGEPGLRELLRLGDEIEILGPTGTRRRMAELAAAVAHRHGAKATRTRVAPAPTRS
jgi:predicted DNA-binding transcriptional regulator YafY